MITASRFHDFSYGHRVVGHENKCAALHGHNGRVHFTVAGNVENDIDEVGRVLDFSVINTRLCRFVEETWDHRFLAWEDDPVMHSLSEVLSARYRESDDAARAALSIVWLPFNPTAELLADYLLRVIGPQQLAGTCTKLIAVTVEETRKCNASAQL